MIQLFFFVKRANYKLRLYCKIVMIDLSQASDHSYKIEELSLSPKLFNSNLGNRLKGLISWLFIIKLC